MAVNDVMRAGLQPSLLELMDNTTIRAVEDWKHAGLDTNAAAMLIAQVDVEAPREPALAIEKAFIAAGATYTTVSSDAIEAAELLGVRRMTHWAIERLGMILTEDVGVPRSKLALMLAAHRRHRPRIRRRHRDRRVTRATATCIRASWSTQTAPGRRPRRCTRAALEFGGTITGEHGVGSLKRDWLPAELGEVGMEVHRSVKAAFDPLGILNPGKVRLADQTNRVTERFDRPARLGVQARPTR